MRDCCCNTILFLFVSEKQDVRHDFHELTENWLFGNVLKFPYFKDHKYNHPQYNSSDCGTLDARMLP